ncbi:beta-ketoacyl-[acyl-carrier-protein] synthase family protein [Amycolatopsis sp. cmx-11-12]|uniref:beta-ketoacyl-[acyl-carrier-protein] synthase family protein n=1 Tax=Amycolatopsis sp. cmx-11-12 TaxID=2785795 RepID=UPI00391737AA
MHPEERRVVMTGIGVVAPGGTGTKQFWDLLTAGRTATRTISLFDATSFRSRVAAECDFHPVAAGLAPEDVGRWDRATQFALVSAREAVLDSGLLGELDPASTGVLTGTAVGLTMSLDREYGVVSDGGRDWLVDETRGSPHLYDYFVPSSMAAEVAWLVEAEGPVGVVSTGCTSGIDVVGHAADQIADGSAEVMIAGASDAPISPITTACFDAIKATTARNDEPDTASRPFDRTRNGFVLGEGSAFFVLEERERALQRGAHIYCEIGGYASRCNAFSMTGLRPDGRELADAVHGAMARARTEPADLGYVNAHGSATKQNDRHETGAYKLALGEHAYRVPISSIKSMVGHSLGAIGSLEIAASALAIEHGVIPPTANLHEPDPACDLDYVPLVARERRVDVALSVGSGFGGFQSAIVLTAPDWRRS